MNYQTEEQKNKNMYLCPYVKKIKTTLMTTKAINEALTLGYIVELKGDKTKRICRDLFGGLVVVSLNADEPVRQATLADKRQATIKH